MLKGEGKKKLRKDENTKHREGMKRHEYHVGCRKNRTIINIWKVSEIIVMYGSLANNTLSPHLHYFVTWFRQYFLKFSWFYISQSQSPVFHQNLTIGI